MSLEPSRSEQVQIPQRPLAPTGGPADVPPPQARRNWLSGRGEGKLAGWRAFGGAGEGALVPQARLSGPTPWVIAIMVTITVIAAATGLALRNIANAAALDLAGGVSVQIIEAQPPIRTAQAQAAQKALLAVPGVVSARVVPQEELDQLLVPWLGSGLGSGPGGGASEADMVPVPAMIDVRVDGAADAARIDHLRAALRKVAPGARVDAQSHWLAPVFEAMDSLRWLAVSMIGLLALAMAAAVLLSARSALGTHRQTIEIVHNLGGTDAQIARIFQRSMGMDAALGSLVGLVLGQVAVIVLGARFAGLGAGLLAGGVLGLLDWLVVALVPVMAVVLAMLTARLSVLIALRKML